MSAVRCCCNPAEHQKFESCTDPGNYIYVTAEAYALIPGGDTVIVYNFECFEDLEILEVPPVGSTIIDAFKSTQADCASGPCQTEPTCADVNLCFTLEVSGITPNPNGYAGSSVDPCDPLECRADITILGVNRTYKIDTTVDPDSSPLYAGALVFEFPECDGLAAYTEVSDNVQVINFSYDCVDDVFYVYSVEVKAGGSVVFTWSYANLDPSDPWYTTGAPMGEALPNQRIPCGLTDLIPLEGSPGVGGTVTVAVANDADCGDLVEYFVAVNCEDPDDTIVVDLDTRAPGDITAIYGDGTYYVTDEISTETPVTVTWSTDPCPADETWYEAVKCSFANPGPPKIRYQVAPLGTPGVGAVGFGTASASDPDCYCITWYQATDRETLVALPIGIHSPSTDCSPSYGCSGCAEFEDAIPIDFDCSLYCPAGAILPGFERLCEEVCSAALGMGAASPEISQRTPHPRRGLRRLWTGAQMVVAYARSKASGRDATPRTISLRQLSCFGDPAAGVEPCAYLRGEPGSRFCGACGCGARKEALLDGDPSKLTFTYLECPKGAPGFSNGPTIEDPGEPS